MSSSAPATLTVVSPEWMLARPVPPVLRGTSSSSTRRARSPRRFIVPGPGSRRITTRGRSGSRCWTSSGAAAVAIAIWVLARRRSLAAAARGGGGRDGAAAVLRPRGRAAERTTPTLASTLLAVGLAGAADRGPRHARRGFLGSRRSRGVPGRAAAAGAALAWRRGSRPRGGRARRDRLRRCGRCSVLAYWAVIAPGGLGATASSSRRSGACRTRASRALFLYVLDKLGL